MRRVLEKVKDFQQAFAQDALASQLEDVLANKKGARRAAPCLKNDCEINRQTN